MTARHVSAVRGSAVAMGIASESTAPDASVAASPKVDGHMKPMLL